ncbi:MAG: YkuS family protein [Clostridium sp.]|nr:YkuS family protein [Clostridium sp.]
MKIAIESNLGHVKDYLQDKDCEVSTLKDYDINLNDFDAIVVTGQNDNLMGIEDTLTNTVVIDASGMTPQEIYHEIQRADM